MGIEISTSNNTYVHGLEKFQDELEKNSINFRVLGSQAIKSYVSKLGGEVYRPPKDLEVDVLVPRSDYLKLKSQTIRKAINKIDGVKYDLSISKYIDFRPHEEFSFLIFKNTRSPIQSELFESRKVSVKNFEITTIPAITLLHTFSVCGGIIRPKDWEKVLLLARYTKVFPDDKFIEADYSDFHSFLHIRKETYPSDIWFLGRMQVLLSYAPPFCGDIAWRIRKRIIKSYFGSSKSW